MKQAINKIYISGAISNDLSGYHDRFKQAENFLREEAIKTSVETAILNPACLPLGLSEEHYMSISISMLIGCNIIYMLQGFEYSLGAVAELALAEKLGLKVIFEK